VFIDRAVIEVVAGKGGSGSEAMRREKGVPRGGPAGGDGGKGGDVLLEADAQLATLLDYSYRRLYKAERGMHGAGKSMTGRSGEDMVLKVPPGTLVYDADSEECIGEMLEPGQSIVVALGGRGGRGNTHFKTSTQQAPRRWEPGVEGEARRVRLELKLIADVGLVGEPNAGKSTFLAAVTAARPKVADYPFTTLAPNLGVVQLSDFRTFVIADIPGIIEGAHKGKGLGHQFLRHIERTRTLALVISVDAPDLQVEYEALRSELEVYSSELVLTPHCVILSKTDLLPPDEPLPDLSAPDAWGIFAVSSVTHRGLKEVLPLLWEASQKAGAGEQPDAEDGWWAS
jgi:GTP-binding protein